MKSLRLSLLLIIVLPTFARAQAPESVRSFFDRAVAKLESVNSGEMTYVRTEHSLMSEKEKRDTLYMLFYGLREPGHLALLVKDKKLTLCFRDSVLTWLSHWSENTIRNDTLSQDKVPDRLTYWFFGSIMNNGMGIKRHLDSDWKQMRIWDSTIAGKRLHYLQFKIPNDDLQDTMIGDETVQYAFDDDANLLAASTGTMAFHQPLIGGRELLSWTFNRTSLDDVRKRIEATIADTTGQRFIVRTNVTQKDWEAKLLKVGDVVPNFGGRTPENDSIQFHDIRANVVLLDFWYTGCGPCRYALPFLRSLQSKYGPKGFTVVGLDPMDEELPIVKYVLKSELLTNPEILIGRNVSDTMFGVRAYPTLILLDKDRRILYTQVGYAKGVEEEIEGEVKKAIASAVKEGKQE
jgi:thiol-disulfide isomerase/thioredoxin